ncbi:MAG: hypothetical protein JSS97_21215, partial [Actinobacteria bacterium]|nr:hypothetical protein [Actinomycetota bacterium]
YWGAWIGNQLTGTEAPWDMGAVSRFEGQTGKPVSLIHFASPFADCSHSPCTNYNFPTAPMTAIREHGAIPFFSWSSQSTPSSLNEPEYQLSDVISGRYDSYIRKFAEEAKAWGHPFFLRFDWEMNGNWFPWGAGVNGNRPAEFVQAWRRVHRIFTAAGATNATWVWCPYVRPQGKTGSIARYYPGKKYVDWTCLDAYNFARNSANPRPWQSFEQLLRPSYEAVTKRIAPGKPMILGELASNGPSPRKARWIGQMFNSIARHYPAIAGLVWFDKYDRDLRWPLESDPASARAFRAGLRRYPFIGNGFSELDASPIPAPR